ncbi:MAG TPA: hypothetical protein VGI99_00020, partial [Gemmataceae bacterium]
MFLVRIPLASLALTASLLTGSGRTSGTDQQPAAAARSQAADAPKAQIPTHSPEWVSERLKEVDAKLATEIDSLVALYRHIHANPELSLVEVKTAARLAEEMKKLGFDVTEKVG